MSSPCICIGPISSGKTLLLKRLSNPSVNEGTSTVETVGSNIVTLSRKPPSSDHPSSRGDERKDSLLSVREIGGQMAPLWPSYYSPETLVLFVIDSSNLFQVSIATVLLMELLSHEKLVGAKVAVAVVLSKIDLTGRKKLNYLKFMMRLDAILTLAGKRVSLLETSATTGEGVEDVRKWLVTHWPRVKVVAKTLAQAAAAKEG